MVKMCCVRVPPISCSEIFSLISSHDLYFLLSKNVIIFFLVFSFFTIHYTNAKQVSIAEPVIMYLKNNYNNISCHHVEEGDALSSAEDPRFSPMPDSIFFHETSCSGGLNSRQACSVESAARADPNRQVYVMFSGPVSELVYEKSCIAKLRQLPNIRFARVHIYEYAKRTPLEEMVFSAPFNKSKWKVHSTANILRFLSLYKWGGVYLDLDIIVVKPLKPLGRNWAGWEDENFVNTAALAISMDGFGIKLAAAMMNELRTNYKPDVWAYNGPLAITRVLQKMCNLSHTTKTCKGIKILDRKYIYPIDYSSHDIYFKPGPLKNVDKAFTHHLWNSASRKLKVEQNSAYAELARKYCPMIYQMYGDKFGSFHKVTMRKTRNIFEEFYEDID